MSHSAENDVPDEDWVGMFRAVEYRTAQEHAREIVSLMLMADEQGESGTMIAAERVKGYTTPRQHWAVIDVLARAVADTFGSLTEFSEHVLTALAEDDAE